MTRIFNVFALTLILAASLIGCASTGDGVQVLTADLDGESVEIVQTRGDDGYVEVDVVVTGADLEIDASTYRWQEDLPAPDDLLERLRAMRPVLVAEITPINASPTDVVAERELVTLRIIEGVQLENRAMAQGCDPEMQDWFDCLDEVRALVQPDFEMPLERELVAPAIPDGVELHNAAMPEAAPDCDMLAECHAQR